MNCLNNLSSYYNIKDSYFTFLLNIPSYLSSQAQHFKDKIQIIREFLSLSKKMNLHQDIQINFTANSFIHGSLFIYDRKKKLF